MGAGSGTRPETPTGPVRSVWPRSSPVKSPEGRQDQGREVPGPESPRRLQLRPPALSGRNLIGHLVPGVFLSEARNVMCCRAWSRQLGLLWVSCHGGAVPQGERIDRSARGFWRRYRWAWTQSRQHHLRQRFYFLPHVVRHPSHTDAITSWQQVVPWANDIEYGPSSSIWTSDTARGLELAKRLEARITRCQYAFL